MLTIINDSNVDLLLDIIIDASILAGVLLSSVINGENTIERLLVIIQLCLDLELSARYCRFGVVRCE